MGIPWALVTTGGSPRCAYLDGVGGGDMQVAARMPGGVMPVGGHANDSNTFIEELKMYAGKMYTYVFGDMPGGRHAANTFAQSIANGTDCWLWNGAVTLSADAAPHFPGVFVVVITCVIGVVICGACTLLVPIMREIFCDCGSSDDNFDDSDEREQMISRP